MIVELPMKKWGSKMVVNWSIVNGSYHFGESVVEVITNKMVEKIAKASGNKRKERRLEVRLNGFEDVYECGAESFKKGSFLKNLIKKSIHKAIETMVQPHNYLPVLWQPVIKNFLGETIEECNEIRLNEIDLLETVQDVRQWYKKYIKFYHPDFLGRELFPHEKIMFSVITETRDKLINFMKRVDEVFGE